MSSAFYACLKISCILLFSLLRHLTPTSQREKVYFNPQVMELLVLSQLAPVQARMAEGDGRRETVHFRSGKKQQKNRKWQQSSLSLLFHSGHKPFGWYYPHLERGGERGLPIIYTTTVHKQSNEWTIQYNTPLIQESHTLDLASSKKLHLWEYEVLEDI